MAKGARASTKKSNHQKLKGKVFGPVEDARTERLSAKLLELAAQAKLKPASEDLSVETIEGTGQQAAKPTSQVIPVEKMEMDHKETKSATASKHTQKGRIEKKRSYKAAIVFPRYKEGKRPGRSVKKR